MGPEAGFIDHVPTASSLCAAWMMSARPRSLNTRCAGNQKKMLTGFMLASVGGRASQPICTGVMRTPRRQSPPEVPQPGTMTLTTFKPTSGRV